LGLQQHGAARSAARPEQCNAVAISAAASHSLALKADGTVAAWSDNFANESTVPPGLSNVTAIAAGLYLSLGLLSDGTIFDIGRNTNVVAASNIVLIAASGVSWLDPEAIRSDGTVFDIKNPTNNLAYPTNTVALAFSDTGYRALLSDGTVVALVNGVAIPYFCCATAVAVGGGILVLHGDGSIVELTFSVAGDVPLWGKVRDMTAVAAASYNSMALKPDGTILCWDATAQAAVAGLSNVTAVAASYFHGLALKADRTVFAWGQNGAGQTNVPPGLTNVTAIAAGGYHSLALRSDGTIVGWGYNAYGQAGGACVNCCGYGAKAISAGDVHNVALLSNGTVYAWGYNRQGQVNVPPGISAQFCPASGPVVAIAAGGAHNLALKSDGTVTAWGYNNHGQTDVPAGLSNVVAIAAGGDHSLALKSDGTIVAWGSNDNGESNVPAGLGPAIAISAGFADSVALVLPLSPNLQAQPGPSGLVLSWLTNYSGFTVQSSDGLAPPVWRDCTNAPAVAGARFWVTNTPSAKSQFYRLKK
jgi:alpha-tubulin suppressor-like RCC1 family protein